MDDFQTIQSLGRFTLIKELTQSSPPYSNRVVKGVGDDAAVIQKDDERFLLTTSETFMEGVDFDLTYMPLHHLGYKVMAALVSDIYAMNGEPETVLINLAVPNKISVEMLTKIYEGVYAAGKEYGADVIGGDLTASHQILAISASATGSVGKDEITYRSGAKVGDAICISGDLGGAIAGLRILQREKQAWQDSGQNSFQPELDEYEYVVQRQLVPAARKELTALFHKEKVIPTSMIDITQGLAIEIERLAEASKVGCLLYQAALPVALETRVVADEMQEDVDKYALYGGEDLELLFTLSEQKVETLSNTFKDITVIGKVTKAETGVKMQTAEGNLVHFE